MSLTDAYALVGATTILELHQAYMDADQRLMKSREWDYNNPALLTNRIKVILADLDPSTLDEEEREWCLEMLWFWHHHAVSCAIWLKNDRAQAQFHATNALSYQREGHPNRITRLLYLLVHDRVAEAEEWAAHITDEVERDTASLTLAEYKAGLFFVAKPLAALKEKFAAYPNIQLVIQLVEMKRATLPVTGLRARLAHGTFPTRSNLAPVLTADGVLTINLDTLVMLAAKLSEISPHELSWLNGTLSDLAQRVAAEDGPGRA